jgi:hypothetical protein
MTNFEFFSLVIGIPSLIAAVIAAVYSYKSFWSSKSPKLVIESSFPHLWIRNIGSDLAKEISGTQDLLNYVPNQMWNFVGPIDYIHSGLDSIASVVTFRTVPQPGATVDLRLEYKNTDGDKFFSVIRIERTSEQSPQLYKRSTLLKWGKM